ncbi:Rne/Rng family ribonuclease [Niallia sp. NCCP-28]|uniref:Rne/Rng family ribonuclease n=1 Tax=Niallia sp. NCCP-28 TaxID=2934712 RepID=UPI002082FAEF|nr:Rne/Rng family ribonuclease [Niallia sp. NCCP-28]GKU81429.1 ribonuclease E [Niallia sp. NCCP-28]
MNRVLVNIKTREKRFAFIKENKLERLYIQQPEQNSSVGNIYLGQATKVIPGMNAVFIEIGEGKAGYLPKEQLASFITDARPLEQKKKMNINSFVKQGERMLVQVVKDAAGTKGSKLTGIIELAGENIIYIPTGRYIAVSKKIAEKEKSDFLRSFGSAVTTEEEGIIFRTSAANCTENQLTEELKRLKKDYQELKINAGQLKKVALLKEEDDFDKELIIVLEKLETGEVIIDDLLESKKWAARFPAFDVNFYQQTQGLFAYYEVENDVEKALNRIVWLKNGAYIIIDEAEAFTMVDVNTGKFEGKQEREDTVFQTNKLACEEVARQLKIRDISGIVLVDFIDMPVKNQQKIQSQMIKELQKDSRQTKVVGFTSLGILQITRKKTVKTLKEVRQSKCIVCNGTGYVLSAESVAFQLERELWEYKTADCELILIEATLDVIHIFSGIKEEHKKRFEELLLCEIRFTVSEFSKPYYRISYVGSLS